jgi:hypothetical protein
LEDLNEVGVNPGISLFGSGYGLLESSYKCDIEPPGPIRHEVR